MADAATRIRLLPCDADAQAERRSQSLHVACTAAVPAARRRRTTYAPTECSARRADVEPGVVSARVADVQEPVSLFDAAFPNVSEDFAQQFKG